MDIRQIRCFVALYEEQSTTKAARRLNIVQPAVSMQLRKLESNFGVKLFERMPHGLLPGDLARSLYPTCLKILGEIDYAQRLLQHTVDDVSGALTIGVIPPAGESFIAKALREFVRKFPRVSVRCLEGDSSSVSGGLASGVLDIGVGPLVCDGSQVDWRLISSEELVVVTRRCVGQNLTTHMRGEDLLKLKLVLPSERSPLRLIINSGFERVGLTIDSALEVDSVPIALQILKTSGWATILPKMALDDHHNRGRLNCMRLIEPEISCSVAVALSTRRPLSSPGKIFVQALENVCIGSAWQRAGPAVWSVLQNGRDPVPTPAHSKLTASVAE